MIPKSFITFDNRKEKAQPNDFSLNNSLGNDSDGVTDHLTTQGVIVNDINYSSVLSSPVLTPARSNEEEFDSRN